MKNIDDILLLECSEQYSICGRIAVNIGYSLIAEDDLKIRYPVSYERIVSGSPITAFELRLAGLFALIWFAMDTFWCVSTFMHWFSL